MSHSTASLTRAFQMQNRTLQKAAANQDDAEKTGINFSVNVNLKQTHFPA